MKTVEEAMTRTVWSVAPNDSMNRAAQLMWENDCGCVPVVDEAGSVVGILTDRDICMAAYTQGRVLAEMQVASASAKTVAVVRPDDSITYAMELMAAMQVRRLPVVDEKGKLVGLLSLGDAVRKARSNESTKSGLSSTKIASVLEAVSKSRLDGSNAPATSTLVPLSA